MKKRTSLWKRAFVFAMALMALLAGSVPGVFASFQIAQTPLPGKSIMKWQHPMPHFVGARVAAGSTLSVSMEDHRQKVLPDVFYTALPAPYVGGTYVWGYKVGGSGPLYPGFTVEATRGTSTQVTYTNNLTGPAPGTDVGGIPAEYMYEYLTVDQTLHWADPLMQMGDFNPYTGFDVVPAVPHLHGGEVPPQVDGGPDAWWTPSGTYYKGHGYYSDSGASAGQAKYTYPNTQEGATLWFHDHALGITRINVYAGLAAFYFLRDDWDTGDATNGPGLPFGNYEIEIGIQDRMFDTNGQWLFPDQPPFPPNPGIHPFWVPEFLGDAIVVNGRTWPFLDVEPRSYRFRFLNGSNARFYELFLVNPVTKLPGPATWVIGTDGGLLDMPVMLNDPAVLKAPKLVIGPGERYDVIIDFSAYAGQTLLMRNTARAPYPKGAPAQGLTTGQILQFRVGTTVSDPSNDFKPTATTQLRQNPIVRLYDPATNTVNAPVMRTRQLTLNEVMAAGGPREVLVNNTKWAGESPRNDAGGFQDFTPITNSDSTITYYSELPKEGEAEIWEIINLTADAHPIHLHLVQFQLVSRQAFDAKKYDAAYQLAFPGGVSPIDGMTYAAGVFIPGYGPPGDYNNTGLTDPTFGVPILGGNPDVNLYRKGPAKMPNPEEQGWKDTVIMYPGEVTTIVVRWAPTDKAIATADLSYPFDPNGGHGYVWHCHIIDHEDNEMMRPYVVTTVDVAITQPADGATFSVGDLIQLEGTAIRTATGADLSGTLDWTFDGTTIGSGTLALWDTTSVSPGTYTITATADDGSRSGSASISITLDLVP